MKLPYFIKVLVIVVLLGSAYYFFMIRPIQQTVESSNKAVFEKQGEMILRDLSETLNRFEQGAKSMRSRSFISSALMDYHLGRISFDSLLHSTSDKYFQGYTVIEAVAAARFTGSIPYMVAGDSVLIHQLQPKKVPLTDKTVLGRAGNQRYIGYLLPVFPENPEIGFDLVIYQLNDYLQQLASINKPLRIELLEDDFISPDGEAINTQGESMVMKYGFPDLGASLIVSVPVRLLRENNRWMVHYLPFTLILLMLIVLLILLRRTRETGQLQLQSQELARINQQLLDKNMELKKINEEMDNFVYRVSHDLRAPVASAQGLCQVCQMEHNQEFYSELQRKTLKKLDHYIFNILDFSRNTRLEVEIRRFHIYPMLQQLKEVCQRPEVSFQIDCTPELEVESDENRIRVILTNLVANACQYRNPKEENSWVKIAIWDNSGIMNIRVSDNGIGIRNEEQQKIFNMFYRATDRQNGSGIGLYIVKEYLKKLKGDIEVKSEYGVGTTFTINIPVKSVSGAPVQFQRSNNNQTV